MSVETRMLARLERARAELLVRLAALNTKPSGLNSDAWRDHWVRKAGPASYCGAKRHRDGNPCEARVEPGKRRCRFHGGRSTGPRTEAGKARALANLRRGNKSSE